MLASYKRRLGSVMQATYEDSGGLNTVVHKRASGNTFALPAVSSALLPLLSLRAPLGKRLYRSLESVAVEEEL